MTTTRIEQGRWDWLQRSNPVFARVGRCETIYMVQRRKGVYYGHCARLTPHRLSRDPTGCGPFAPVCTQCVPIIRSVDDEDRPYAHPRGQ